MNATQKEVGPIGRVLVELAQERGYSGLEDLAAALNETTGKDYTVEELAECPRYASGHDLDGVLNLTEAEKMRFLRAVSEYFGTDQ